MCEGVKAFFNIKDKDANNSPKIWTEYFTNLRYKLNSEYSRFLTHINKKFKIDELVSILSASENYAAFANINNMIKTCKNENDKKLLIDSLMHKTNISVSLRHFDYVTKNDIAKWIDKPNDNVLMLLGIFTKLAIFISTITIDEVRHTYPIYDNIEKIERRRIWLEFIKSLPMFKIDDKITVLNTELTITNITISPFKFAETLSDEKFYYLPITTYTIKGRGKDNYNITQYELFQEIYKREDNEINTMRIIGNILKAKVTSSDFLYTSQTNPEEKRKILSWKYIAGETYQIIKVLPYETATQQFILQIMPTTPAGMKNIKEVTDRDTIKLFVPRDNPGIILNYFELNKAPTENLYVLADNRSAPPPNAPSNAPPSIRITDASPNEALEEQNEEQNEARNTENFLQLPSVKPPGSKLSSGRNPPSGSKSPGRNASGRNSQGSIPLSGRNSQPSKPSSGRNSPGRNASGSINAADEGGGGRKRKTRRLRKHKLTSKSKSKKQKTHKTRKNRRRSYTKV